MVNKTRLSRTTAFGLASMLLAGGSLAMAEQKAKDASPDTAARGFIATHDSVVRPLEIALNLAWWNANTTGKDADFAAKVEAQNRYDDALSDRDRFESLKALQSAKLAHEIGDRDMVDADALTDELEIDPVGIDQVRVGFLIPLALLDRVTLELDDVLVDVLGFAPAKRNFAPPEQEIGHPGIGLLRLVDDGERRIDALEQRLQRRAIAVFGRLATGILATHLFQKNLNVH